MHRAGGAAPSAGVPLAPEPCRRGPTRLPATEPTLPESQEGDLSAVLPGAWQYTHYDLGLGNGLEVWDEDTDMRYVFDASGTLTYCVGGIAGTEPSERSETFVVEGSEITLGNDNSFAAIAWTADSLLMSNQADEIVFFVRR